MEKDLTELNFGLHTAWRKVHDRSGASHLGHAEPRLNLKFLAMWLTRRDFGIVLVKSAAAGWVYLNQTSHR